MNFKTIIIFLYFLSSLAFAQHKILLLCNQETDTLHDIQENIDRNQFYEVSDLKSINGEYVFRSWAGSSCIEIIKNGKQLHGRIYFAVEGFNSSNNTKKRFAKKYELSKKITQRLLSLIGNYKFYRREHQSGKIPITHTFEIMENLNVETYTTDSPQFEYKIFDIVPMNFYMDKFDKEIPFENYTFWGLKMQDGEPYYMTKKNE